MELVSLAKSAGFMAWFEKHRNITSKTNLYISNIPNLTHREKVFLNASILSDLNNINENEIRPLGEILVYSDCMLIGAVPFLPGVYFNNLLCAAPGSRLIKIILKNIARHYAFIKRNNALFAPQLLGNHTVHNEILSGYRNPAAGFTDPVTRWLTGPGVIIDTLINLIYRTTPDLRKIAPNDLGILLQRDDFGLTIKKQTLDTPMGLK